MDVFVTNTEKIIAQKFDFSGALKPWLLLFGMSHCKTMPSFGILNVLAFQNYAWFGGVPNHLKIIGVFVTLTMKFFV